MKTRALKLSGAIIFVIGLLASLTVFFISVAALLIYTIPVTIIGFIIMLNKKEDVIEEIKSGGK